MVLAALPDTLPYRKVTVNNSGANPKDLLQNIKFARQNTNTGNVNHITGDVHYLALGLPPSKTILTIHDLRILELAPSLKRKLLKLFWFSLPVRSVRYVTVISQVTKEELLRELSVKPEKVRVIPNCVSPHFTYSPKVFCQEQPRILHLGTKENKNLEGLIQALEGISCHLRIIGKLDPHQQGLLENYSILYTNVHDLSFEQVVEEYRLADIVSFVSFYEGFGLPIIEAQATGRPVITSSVSSMPEVAGEGALLVNPYRKEEIRAGIVRLLKDVQLRKALVEKGLKNVNRFQPEAVALQYAELYREIMEEN